MTSVSIAVSQAAIKEASAKGDSSGWSAKLICNRDRGFDVVSAE
ncbi:MULTISPECIES: hypothetical protein [Pantoea]|nr:MULTISPECIES: hypothetical protein [Pantoea]MDH2124135.1 hypothetical protein [Pantoea brenneri]